MHLLSLLSLFAFALAAPTTTSDPTAQYDGVKVLRIPTSTQAFADSLSAIVDKHGVELWTHHFAPNSNVDVQVSPEKYDAFVGEVNALLSSSGYGTGNRKAGILTMHEDLGESIRKESEGSDRPVSNARVGLASPTWFTSYHSYADHLTFLSDLVRTYPNNARLVSTGTSLQGRNITGVQIFGSSGAGVKPAVVWHGTVHAREWIGTMVTEYLAYQLLSTYATDTKVKGWVDNYDFYVFPVVNPDGFVYTQTTSRLWRKNRQSPPSGSSCYGRDINRNWNVAWSQTNGASTDPCSDAYKGLAAADAPETVGLQNFMKSIAQGQGGKLYTDWHSYSQLFMSPYGYSCSKLPSNSAKYNSLTSGFASALAAVHGTQFDHGPICSTIYATTGDSTDYAQDIAGFDYSFAAELRDTGTYGFVLPANQIVPTGEEVWGGVRWLLDNI